VHGIANLAFSKAKQIYYPPNIIKKAITGNGRASKEEIQKKLICMYP
jgi:Holliday junction resolvasome RuvABC endonuclease subunit